MPTLRAQQRVLEGAFDELNLWELPGRHEYHHSGGVSVTPDIPLAEVREAAVAALRAGLVLLCEAGADGWSTVDPREAVTLAEDESEWEAETASRDVTLAITPAGEQASHHVFAAYRSASPFLSLGVADPHVWVDADDSEASEPMTDPNAF